MKRLLLIDRTETPNYAEYFRLGIQDVYLLDALDALPEVDRNIILSLGPGDAAMLVGAQPFHYLQQRYHFCIRSENYFDCAKLPRLSIEGGAFVKEVIDKPEKEEVDEFLSPNFAEPVDFSWFKHKILHTLSEVDSFLSWLESLPEETIFALDYEASGMPLDVWFELSGVSICTYRYGGFISLTDLRHNTTKEEYDGVLKRLGKFLEKNQSRIWTYNMQYEFQVSRRMLGVDLYNLCDAGVFNVLDGNHLNKKYSLKWSANLIGATVWDTAFDRISDLIDSMLFSVEGKTKADRKKVLKVTKENFKLSPEWEELTKLYPNHIQEFEDLILEYWGNPFMCIPSSILGHYCNLDAFYTLMIYYYQSQKYTTKAIETFMDNFRLATRLHSCGIPKDEGFRLEYHNFCLRMMAWGITYCATARCAILMKITAPKMAKLSKFSPVLTSLLKESKFFKGDPIEQLKYILSSNIDTLDTYETGLDEGMLLMKYGPEFAEPFVELVAETKAAIKMKQKIDAGVVRRKKLLNELAPKYSELVGLDKVKLGKKLDELEKYLYNESAYNELLRICRDIMPDLNHIPDEIIAFGQRFDLLEYSDYISNNYFKCKSPIENDQIVLEMAGLYPTQSAYLAALMESIQQLPGQAHFYQNLGINTVEEAYLHFFRAWSNYDSTGNLGDYPQKMYDLAYTYYSDLKAEQIKTVWSNFDGYNIQEQIIPDVSKNCEIYGLPFNDQDLNENFFFIRKLTINYLLYKKHAKILSTYIDGMFLKTDINVIEDKDTHVMIREAMPGEEGAITKMRAHFQCMEKSSKRWSSGYHTIISHSDIKSVVRSYPGHLLSYFDISSAEVKSAGFASGDPNLIDMFKKGIDVYINTAKIYLGDEGWNALSDKERKKWRKKFKTVFLGILYGLGKNSLAARLDCSVEEAERVIQAIYHAYPKLRDYVAAQQEYPLKHDGCVNTFFGDRLQVDEWRLYKKSKNIKEKKNLEARIKRLGCNLPIQGGTSTAMSSGFFNDVRVAKEQGWNLTSFITVHDSNTCDFSAEKLWEIRPFYDKNFTEFCYGTTGIMLLFDLLVGVNYNDVCDFKQIDDNTIELKGTARSLLQIMDEMDRCPGLKWSSDIPREEIIPKYVEEPMKRFIIEKGTSMVMDQSEYKVKFYKH